MKRASTSFPAIIVLSATLSFIPAFAQDKPLFERMMGHLQVVVVGFQSATGDVKIALSNSEANYASKSQAFRGASANIENDKATTVFANLPYGEYAVRVYHDASNSRRPVKASIHRVCPLVFS